MQRFLSFFIGSMIGALVGATLALLFAPSSGDELRLEMQERANRLKEDVQSAATARRIELEQQLAALRAPKQQS